MAAAGWTSPTGVWLPVAGAENGAAKVFVVSVVEQEASGRSRRRVLAGLGRCGGEYLWVYDRRGGVGRPARRCRVVG